MVASYSYQVCSRFLTIRSVLGCPSAAATTLPGGPVRRRFMTSARRLIRTWRSLLMLLHLLAALLLFMLHDPVKIVEHVRVGSL